MRRQRPLLRRRGQSRPRRCRQAPCGLSRMDVISSTWWQPASVPEFIGGSLRYVVRGTTKVWVTGPMACCRPSPQPLSPGAVPLSAVRPSRMSPPSIPGSKPFWERGRWPSSTLINRRRRDGAITWPSFVARPRSSSAPGQLSWPPSRTSDWSQCGTSALTSMTNRELPTRTPEMSPPYEPRSITAPCCWRATPARFAVRRG